MTKIKKKCHGVICINYAQYDFSKLFFINVGVCFAFQLHIYKYTNFYVQVMLFSLKTILPVQLIYVQAI